MPAAYEGTNFISHFCNAKIFHMATAIFHLTLCIHRFYAVMYLRGDFMEIKAKCKFDFDSIRALTHLSLRARPADDTASKRRGPQKARFLGRGGAAKR